MSEVLWGYNLLELLGMAFIVTFIAALGMWLRGKGKKDAMWYFISAILIVLFVQNVMAIDIFGWLNDWAGAWSSVVVVA